MPKSDACQVRWKGGAGWETVSVVEAIELGSAVEKRCIECHGRVRAHRAARNGAFAAHIEHMSKHTGCSLGAWFQSPRSPHPEALV
jgi:hypothetical protein